VGRGSRLPGHQLGTGPRGGRDPLLPAVPRRGAVAVGTVTAVGPSGVRVAGTHEHWCVSVRGSERVCERVAVKV